MSGPSPGQRAPEIDAIASNGQRFVLSKQEGLCTVVYFFPKAFTPGCTAETKMFRDNYVELLLAGANLIGISTDDEKTQCEFAGSTRAPFPILPDADHKICRAYDVEFEAAGVAFRGSFLIDKTGTVRHQVVNDLPLGRNVDEMLRMVDALQFTEEHGEVCPAEWKPGKATIKADPKQSKVADQMASGAQPGR